MQRWQTMLLILMIVSIEACDALEFGLGQTISIKILVHKRKENPRIYLNGTSGERKLYGLQAVAILPIRRHS